jgi:hypothetical protein
LGGANLKAALQALQCNDLDAFASVALEYYDKAYSKSLQNRPRGLVRNVPLVNPGQPVCVRTLRQLGNDLTTLAETAAR